MANYDTRFDDIEYENGGYAYVLVGSNTRFVDGRSVHPARMVGHCWDDKDRGTPLDGRRLVFIGDPYHHRINDYTLIEEI